jgi:hypothetical protein
MLAGLRRSLASGMTCRVWWMAMVALALPTPSGAQAGGAAPACTTLACDVRAEFDRTRAMVMGAADAMPEEKFGFRPTGEQRTFAGQLLHIGTVDVLLLGTLGAKTAPPKVNEKVTSKADVLTELTRVLDFDAAVLKELSTDVQLVERVRSVPFLGPTVSRLRVILYALTHTQDIYGQLVGYLRLNGITPPASVRP